MQFKDIVMQRYATKTFDGRRVSEEKVCEILEFVRFAPSALNLQPWKIKVITDQAVKEQLRQVSHDQAQITTCSHLFVFCADTDYDALIHRLEALLAGHGAPKEQQQMVIDMARAFVSAMTGQERFAWSQAQTYLALGNALNGAKALGVDSCPMGGFDPHEYSRILHIPPHLVPVMLCPVGYAADTPAPKIRIPLAEMIF